MLEHREVRLRESAGGRRGPHPGELGVVVLLLELLLLVHARVVLERGAAGPDHGGPVEGAAASSAAVAAAVGADVDPGDGGERRELGLRLAPVERGRAPAAAAGGGRGGEGGVVPVGGGDVAARRVVLRGRPRPLRMLDIEFYSTSTSQSSYLPLYRHKGLRRKRRAQPGSEPRRVIFENVLFWRHRCLYSDI